MSFDLSQLRRTLFYVEGQRTALLMTRNGNGYRQRVLAITSAESALTYCRAHAAGLVYCPADPEQN